MSMRSIAKCSLSRPQIFYNILFCYTSRYHSLANGFLLAADYCNSSLLLSSFVVVSTINISTIRSSILLCNHRRFFSSSNVVLSSSFSSSGCGDRNSVCGVIESKALDNTFFRLKDNSSSLLSSGNSFERKNGRVDDGGLEGKVVKNNSENENKNDKVAGDEGEVNAPNPQAPIIPGLTVDKRPSQVTQGTGGDNNGDSSGDERGGRNNKSNNDKNHNKTDNLKIIKLGNKVPKGFERYYQLAFLAKFPNYSITAQTTSVVNKKLGPEICKFYGPLVVELNDVGEDKKNNSKNVNHDKNNVDSSRQEVREKMKKDKGVSSTKEKNADDANDDQDDDDKDKNSDNNLSSEEKMRKKQPPQRSETEMEQRALEEMEHNLNETTIIMRSVGPDAARDMEIATATTLLELYIHTIHAHKQKYVRRVKTLWFMMTIVSILVFYRAYVTYRLFSAVVDFESLQKVVMSKSRHMAEFFNKDNESRLMQYFIDARTFHDDMTAMGKDVYVLVSTYYPIVPILLLCLIPIMAAMNSAFNASARMVAKQATLANTEGKTGTSVQNRFRFTKVAGVATRLSDIAGLTEAKHEVAEVIDFLKNPQHYRSLGARLPKGILLEGPPGNGKTLLAKAVAGEATVNFVSCSGSEFEEIYVGVGAQRVRELFKQARASRPCVCFIDEIDAFGRKRQSDRGGSSRSTLNAFLSELDGFKDTSGIIVLAATNRADILDPALTRSGRFDRKISIDLPPHKDRKAIAIIHLKPLKLDPGLTVDGASEALASLTPGCSAADIFNICNEAAIIASRNDLDFVTMDCFKSALDRVLIGLEKRSRKLSFYERQRLAYHEAGKTVLAWFLPLVDPVVKTTITPRGTRVSRTKKLYSDIYIKSQERLRQLMIAQLGGFVSEEHFFEDISSSSSEDLRIVTNQAKQQICTYGMDTEHVGHFGYDMPEDALQKPFGPDKEDQIDMAVTRTVEECSRRARELLLNHVNQVHIIANTLLKQETIDAKEMWLLLGDRPEMSEEFQKYLES